MTEGQTMGRIAAVLVVAVLVALYAAVPAGAATSDLGTLTAIKHTVEDADAHVEWTSCPDLSRGVQCLGATDPSTPLVLQLGYQHNAVVLVGVTITTELFEPSISRPEVAVAAALTRSIGGSALYNWVTTEINAWAKASALPKMTTASRRSGTTLAVFSAQDNLPSFTITFTTV
jgi:hypothetical protein